MGVAWLFEERSEDPGPDGPPHLGFVSAPKGREDRMVHIRAWSNENDQVDRAISTGQLHALLRFHIRPINVVVFHGSDREYWF